MSGLQITQIDHVSIIITNVERSRRFYCDVLGLKEIAKPRTFDFVVVWFDLGNQQLHLLLKERPDVRRWYETGDVFQAAYGRLDRALRAKRPASPRHFLRLAAL